MATQNIDPRIMRIMDCIRSHPAKRLSQEEAAALAGVTPTHFRVLFKEAAGISYRSFQLQARLEQAKLLLVETELSISDVAATLGYDDVYLFSRQFKKAFKLSPTQWRHQALRSSLSEARLVFEQGVVELACQYATEDDFQQLHSIADDMVKVTTYNEATLADGLFHRYLVEASHNAAILSLQNLINSFFTVRHADLSNQLHDALNPIGTWNKEKTQYLVQQHHELVSIISKRNPEIARLAIRKHIIPDHANV